MLLILYFALFDEFKVNLEIILLNQSLIYYFYFYNICIRKVVFIATLKRNHYRNILLLTFSVFVLSIFSLSIVYSVLSTNMNISGEGTATENKLLKSKCYYYEGFFYPDELHVESYKIKDENSNPVKNISDMLNLMSDNAEIYIMSEYKVTGTETILVNERNLNIIRYDHKDILENSYVLFSINSGATLSFKTENNGKITFNGNDVDTTNKNFIKVEGKDGIFYNSGTLNLVGIESTSISIKNSKGDYAGAICNKEKGTLGIEGATISSNSSDAYAGGIYNDGSCTLKNVSITNNTTSGNGESENGLCIGAGFTNNGTLSISDTINIIGNTNKKAKTDTNIDGKSNLSLSDGKIVTVSSKL